MDGQDEVIGLGEEQGHRAYNATRASEELMYSLPRNLFAILGSC